MAGKVTLEELENHYSIDDLADLHEAMDVDIEVQNYAAESD